MMPLVMSDASSDGVMINDTVKKYKIKKNTRFTWKPLQEKTIGRGESFTMYIERDYKI